MILLTGGSGVVGQAPVEHSSLQTTELDIGIQQNLSSAPCDALGLKL